MIGTVSLVVKQWVFERTMACPSVVASPINGQSHVQPVPDWFEFPFVVFWREQADEDGAIGSGITASSASFRYIVKVVDNIPNTDRIATVYNEIHAMLEDENAPQPIGFSIDCYRTSELLTDELPDQDREYAQVGGFYQFFVTQE